MNSAPFFYVAGATASGKSALAVDLAEALGGEIIGCDPPQLYRDLPVLTAQPEAEWRARVPHHLIGLLPPEQEISAGWYARQAAPLLAELRERGVPAIVCGGSGLYLRALTHGLDELPATPPELRERLAALPPAEAREELLGREPDAARWIALENPRRVQRALELLETTGRTLAELRTAEHRPPHPGIAGLVLTWPRAELHGRIARRTEQMLAGGALDEAAAMRDQVQSVTFSRVIGLRECQECAEGKLSRPSCAERIAQATRQYAKRQETWFRKYAGPMIDAASERGRAFELALAWRAAAV